ncbi:MAG TPA: transposase [Synergistales bacterium]|jgi:transposase-like protein|nr:MAG: Transposase mutator type [Synergistales bacterium 58_81]HCR38931.1 hypothetical protein [Synergistaceae bacterium]HPA59671.1 transposase [Synergistales bacterium]HQO83509.1 transposase [Synergistales bacterium]HQQ11446.1 transposase [Synergistales bacterium]
MDEADRTKARPEIIRIDEEEIRNRPGNMAKGTAEEALDALPEAEGDSICRASRHERSPERLDTCTGHYDRKLHAGTGKATPKTPKEILDTTEFQAPMR